MYNSNSSSSSGSCENNGNYRNFNNNNNINENNYYSLRDFSNFSCSLLKDEFVLECDKGNYYIDDQFICRVSINQDASYDEIDFNYEFDDGIELVDVRSNYEKVWQITNDKQVISAKTKSDSQETGLQEYGILLFKAKKDGIHSIKLTNIKSKNSSNNMELTYDDVNSEVKVISTNNNIKEINSYNIYS